MMILNKNQLATHQWVPNITLKQAGGGAPSLLAEAATLARLDNYLRYKMHYAQDIQ